MASATPKRLPAAERRAQLIDVASELFTQHGWHGTTTRLIAEHAGVTEPVLYRHFSGKADLYLACLDKSLASLRAAIQQAVDANENPAAITDAMAHAGISGITPPQGIGQLWAQAIAEAHSEPELAEAVARQFEVMHEFLTRLYEQARTTGGAREDIDPAAEAWQYLALGQLHITLTGLDLDPMPVFEPLLRDRRRWLGVTA